MNKADLIGSIADKSELSKAEASSALDAFVSSVSDALASGDRVSLVGFGSFSVDRREARMGRNPRTGEEIQIAAKNVVKFKPGAGLSDAVN
jgi:DNA-binding protein HU-beta